MKKFQKISAVVALLSVSTLAFAGGPESNLPIKGQLQQEAKTAHAVLHDAKLDVNTDQLMQQVQRLNYAVQNTAAQMHVKAPVAKMVSLHATRAELVKNIQTDSAWIAAQKA